MDETPVYFYMVPSRTIDRKSKKSVRTTKPEKKRVTASLSYAARGHLLPPMTILKGTTKQSIQNMYGNGVQ